MGCRTTETEGNCGSQSSGANRGTYPHMLFSTLGPGEVAPCGSSWAAALAGYCTEGDMDCPDLCSKNNCQWELCQGCWLCHPTPRSATRGVPASGVWRRWEQPGEALGLWWGHGITNWHQLQLWELVVQALAPLTLAQVQDPCVWQ